MSRSSDKVATLVALGNNKLEMNDVSEPRALSPPVLVVNDKLVSADSVSVGRSAAFVSVTVPEDSATDDGSTARAVVTSVCALFKELRKDLMSVASSIIVRVGSSSFVIFVEASGKGSTVKVLDDFSSEGSMLTGSSDGKSDGSSTRVEVLSSPPAVVFGTSASDVRVGSCTIVLVSLSTVVVTGTWSVVPRVVLTPASELPAAPLSLKDTASAVEVL